MNSLNINRNQPAFGMAFKFKEGGAKRMAQAFINAPAEAKRLIKMEKANKDVDIFVSADSINVKHRRLTNSEDFQRKAMLDSLDRLTDCEVNHARACIDVENAFRDPFYYEKKPFYNAQEEAKRLQKIGKEIEAEEYSKTLTVDSLTKELEELADA